MLAITFANTGTTRVELSDMDVSLTYPRRNMRSPLMKLSGRGPGCARGKDTRASLGALSSRVPMC